MATSDVNKLIGVLFLSRNLAHQAHLKARGIGSYAAHTALGDFYEAIVEKADAFAEAWMGCYDAPVVAELDNEAMEVTGDDIAKTLRAHVDYVKANRAKVCGANETALLNMIDDIVATYYAVLYKLSFLK